MMMMSLQVTNVRGIKTKANVFFTERDCRGEKQSWLFDVIEG